jgi:putative SOS response-associated peptidase YedK
MCGRARLSSDVSEIKIAFGIPPERPSPNFPPSWNVAPTDSLPIVRFNPKEGQRSLDMMRWGLIPSHSPAGEWVRSFAIVTTAPNELCAELHNRMPAIIAPEAWPAWLGEEPADEAQ